MFSETPVSDVSPLAGMKLTELSFTPKNITHGIDVVRNMKTIERLGTRCVGGILPRRVLEEIRRWRVRKADVETTRLPDAPLRSMGQGRAGHACREAGGSGQ